MASTETSALAFKNDLMVLVKDIVWKNTYEAIINEDSQYSGEVEEYLTAASSLLEHYSTSQLVSMLSFDDSRFNTMIGTVDQMYRAPLRILRNYQEHNDYYRTLAGLPPEHAKVHGARAKMQYGGYVISLNEVNIPAVQRIQFAQSTNHGEKIEYLHQLTPDQCLYLEAQGLLGENGINIDNITATDKNYRYLQHLTRKRVHPFVARLADRFSLLYAPETKLPALSQTFQIQYEASRMFMIQRYYTEAYKNRYEHYEGFVGLAILFMTMQQLNVIYLDTDITRDFFDMDSIKIVYEAYSVPFYPTIPSDYHLKVVKLINRLLAYKGSNHIFFDLAALFDYDKLSIYQYYLMKRQRLNVDGSPHYEYDYTYDHRGNVVDREINYPASYDFSFVKRTIGGESPYDAVNDENNYVNYLEVINADKYWLDDGDLRDKMYKSEYNFIETKYIGMQMQLSVSEFFYNNVYFMRMLMDNRDVFSKLTVSFSKTGLEIDIFSLVIYLHALIVKKLGWTGEFVIHPAKYQTDESTSGFRSIYTGMFDSIPSEATKIAKIKGFNFKDDLQTIINEIIITGQRNSVTVTQLSNDNGKLIDTKTGYYLYPIANKYTRVQFEEEEARGNDGLWTSMDVEVYSFKDGNIEKYLGRAENLPCHYISSVDNKKTTYRFEGGIGNSPIGSNVYDVVETCLKDVVFKGDPNAAKKARKIVQTYRIDVNNASVDLFTGNDGKEDKDFIDLLIKTMDLSNAASVNTSIANAYDGMTKIREFIHKKMVSTKDPEVYMAYKHLNQVLMTVEVLPSVIEKRNTPNFDYSKPIYAKDVNGNIIIDKNGEPIIESYELKTTPNLAVSYEDLLEDINPPMEIRLMGLTTDDDLNDEIDYCLVLLQNLCKDLKYVRTYGIYNVEVVIEYLYKLIKFFKSVKVQLINFKVIYLFDSQVDNMIRFIDELAVTMKTCEVDDDTFMVSLFDTIHMIYDQKVIDEEFIPKDLLVQYLALITLKTVVLDDKIHKRISKNRVWNLIDIFDDFKHLRAVRLMTDGLGNFEDWIYYSQSEVTAKITLIYKDMVKAIVETTLMSRITYTDIISHLEMVSDIFSAVKMSAKIGFIYKDVTPGHPHRKYETGYFLYDDREGSLTEVVNTTGMGLVGILTAYADETYSAYIMTLDTDDMITLNPSDVVTPEEEPEVPGTPTEEDDPIYSIIPEISKDPIPGGIGLWSNQQYHALRFVDDMDLGGTYANLQLSVGIKPIVKPSVKSSLFMKDELILVDRVEKYALGVPVDGSDTAMIAENNNTIEGIVSKFDEYHNDDVIIADANSDD